MDIAGFVNNIVWGRTGGGMTPFFFAQKASSMELKGNLW